MIGALQEVMTADVTITNISRTLCGFGKVKGSNTQVFIPPRVMLASGAALGTYEMELIENRHRPDKAPWFAVWVKTPGEITSMPRAEKRNVLHQAAEACAQQVRRRRERDEARGKTSFSAS